MIQSLRFIVFLPDSNTEQGSNRKIPNVLSTTLALGLRLLLPSKWRLRFYLIYLIFIGNDRLDRKRGLCLCLWNWVFGKTVKLNLHWQPGRASMQLSAKLICDFGPSVTSGVRLLMSLLFNHNEVSFSWVLAQWSTSSVALQWDLEGSRNPFSRWREKALQGNLGCKTTPLSPDPTHRHVTYFRSFVAVVTEQQAKLYVGSVVLVVLGFFCFVFW